MEEIIRNQYRYPLSYQDIKKIANGKVNVFLYEELENIKHIDELFYPYNGFIILYQSTPNFGHWVSLLKVDNHTIEHFDPYGLNVDDELNFPNEMNFEPMLSNLILKSGYKKIISNVYPLQSEDKTVNTCGRWAVIRQLMKKYKLKDFISLFHNQKLEPDFYVTALTMFV